MNPEYNINIGDIILVQITTRYMSYVAQNYDFVNDKNEYTILGKIRDISYIGFMYITIDVISTNILPNQIIFNNISRPATISMKPNSAHYISEENIKILETNET